MGLDKARGQSDYIQEVSFKLVDSSGTPSIADVCPPGAAASVSVADTAQGRATITIKNMKGPAGKTNIQCTPYTTSTESAVVSRSYSGNDLTFEIHTENDASSDTDSSVDVVVRAF